MKLLVNKDVEGFATTSKKITILKGEAIIDGKKVGLPFYHRINKTGIIKFNLPKGLYDITEGEVTSLNEPVKYDFVDKYLKEFAPDFNPSNIPKINIIVAPNVNKCSVNIERDYAGEIPPLTAMLDPSFVNKPFFIIVYIIGHEYGHFYFRGFGQDSEKACDALSVYIMLKIGYNPSQCICAINQSLSHRSEALIRKDEIYNELLKHN